MSKEQFIKGNSIKTWHTCSGGEHAVTFEFKKIDGDLCIIANYDNKRENQHFQIKHTLMNDCADAIIDWLKKNRKE